MPINYNSATDEYQMKVTNFSDSSVTLSWKGDDDVYSGLERYYFYEIQYKKFDGNWTTEEVVKHRRISNGYTTTFRDLEENAVYSFRVLPYRSVRGVVEYGEPSAVIVFDLDSGKTAILLRTYLMFVLRTVKTVRFCSSYHLVTIYNNFTIFFAMTSKWMTTKAGMPTNLRSPLNFNILSR